jgi:hypothetical protein
MVTFKYNEFQNEMQLFSRLDQTHQVKVYIPGLDLYSTIISELFLFSFIITNLPISSSPPSLTWNDPFNFSNTVVHSPFACTPEAYKIEVVCLKQGCCCVTVSLF